MKTKTFISFGIFCSVILCEIKCTIMAITYLPVTTSVLGKYYICLHNNNSEHISWYLYASIKGQSLYIHIFMNMKY